MLDEALRLFVDARSRDIMGFLIGKRDRRLLAFGRTSTVWLSLLYLLIFIVIVRLAIEGKNWAKGMWANRGVEMVEG